MKKIKLILITMILAMSIVGTLNSTKNVNAMYKKHFPLDTSSKVHKVILTKTVKMSKIIGGNSFIDTYSIGNPSLKRGTKLYVQHVNYHDLGKCWLAGYHKYNLKAAWNKGITGFIVMNHTRIKDNLWFRIVRSKAISYKKQHNVNNKKHLIHKNKKIKL